MTDGYETFTELNLNGDLDPTYTSTRTSQRPCGDGVTCVAGLGVPCKIGSYCVAGIEYLCPAGVVGEAEKLTTAVELRRVQQKTHKRHERALANLFIHRNDMSANQRGCFSLGICHSRIVFVSFLLPHANTNKGTKQNDQKQRI